MEALGLDTGAFFAFNKNSAELTLLEIDDMMTINASERIKHLKKILKEDIPEKCYDPVPYGSSGNMVLSKNCSFCRYKDKCWEDANGGRGLRAFKYSQSIKHFTKIVVEPKVDEIW